MTLMPYRILPIIEDHRAWSRETYGETTDRIRASRALARRIVQALRSIEESREVPSPYAEAFILAMDLAWRADGRGAPETAVDLVDALGAHRIKPSIRSAIQDLSGPYIPRGADVMAWSVRAAAKLGLSSDRFVTVIARRLEIFKSSGSGIPLRLAA